MNMKTVLAGLFIASIITPALADEFYIVRSPTTKKCTIVSQKPTSSTTTVVGNGMFKTRVEAENQMKTTKVCEER